MPIPAEVAHALPHLTVEQIQAEENAEVRRVMLEHFGYDRYLRDSGAAQVHRDECGVLWRVDLPGDEPLVMVEVVNSTPEPDGTSRTYFLRVPPRTPTAREAVAWTFGLDAEEYSPAGPDVGDALQHPAGEHVVQRQPLQVHVPDVAVARGVRARSRSQRGQIGPVVQVAQRLGDEVAPAHGAVAVDRDHRLAGPAPWPSEACGRTL